jgi:hypothetical protein
MTINTADIKLLKSQVLADVPEGGGAATGVEVIDGQSNNLFADVSELDRVYGNVSLRKVFIGVRTSTVDGLYGVNAMVSDPPDDPNVSALLFATDDAFDTRTAAQSRIESYLTRGTEYAGLLFGSTVAGMRAFAILQRVNVPVPSVGTTLLLVSREGSAASASQYVRITAVSSIERTFAVPGQEEKEFKRLQVNVEISDELREDMPGCSAADSYRDSTVDFTTKTRLYDTVVADAARYYGTAALATPVVFDALSPVYTVEVPDIYQQIVPSPQIETPIADARLNQQTGAVVAIGAEITQNLTLNFTATSSLYVGGGILPGSLSVRRSGITVTDSGGGLLKIGAAEVGSIDYGNGLLILSANVFGTSAGTHAVTYTPAAAPVVVSRSIGVPVLAQSQRLSYVLTLDPVPSHGSLQFSYLSGGRWYVMTDSGAGALTGGQSNIGAGSLNYDTGTVAVTLGALPDVGSQIIYAWAPATSATTVTASGMDLSGRVYADVTLQPCKPGGLSLTWLDGTTTRTVTDDGAGQLTGDAIGRVWYGSGRVQMSPNILPAPGVSVAWSLTSVTPQAVQVATLTDSGSAWTTTLTGAPIKARSLRLAVITSRPVRRHPGDDVTTVELMQAHDDGVGNLYVTGASGNLVIGSVNYGSGAVSLAKITSGYTETQGVWERKIPFGGNISDPAYITHTGDAVRTLSLSVLATGASVTPTMEVPGWGWWGSGWAGAALRAQYGGSDAAAQAGTFQLAPLRVALSAWPDSGPGYGKALSAVRFQVGTDVYVSDGYDLVRNPSPSTGEGEVTGAVSGYFCSLSAWPVGASPMITNARIGAAPATFAGNLDMLLDAAVFRTAASPIKPGAFSAAGKFDDGSTFSASSDLNGVINSGGVFGKIDFRSGTVSLRFGEIVATPSNPLNPPTGVVDVAYLGVAGVQWIKVKPVQADTLRYNATAYTYVPLDADILGLDPVRLPSDGRVPIYRKGEVVVIHHTGELGPVTVAPAQVLNCGRQRLAHVRIVGANGLPIQTGYTANLDAGTVTVNDITGWVQPVRLQHRVEDMRMCADVQITGQLRLTGPLSHSFPAGSWVSSALLIGNMGARVSGVFDQETWTNVWSDDLIGNSAGGTYDSINNPITVTNLGAVTERWALRFTSSTSFSCYGEHLGLIGVGTINSTFAPINPASGVPYFSIPATGWGGGWALGNVLRPNTVGALAPVWCARVIKQSTASAASDSFTLAVRGDVDTP